MTVPARLVTVLVEDAHDPRVARAASGLLCAFNAAGVLEPADVHVAVRVGRLGGETDERVLLALALAVRAVRLGSVCVALAEIGRTVLGAGDELVDVSALPWPEPAAWLAACAASPLVADGVAPASEGPVSIAASPGERGAEPGRERAMDTASEGPVSIAASPGERGAEPGRERAMDTASEGPVSIAVGDRGAEPGRERAVGTASAGRPLRLVDGLLYLDRYWRHEEVVRTELTRRSAAAPPAVDLDVLAAGLAAAFTDPRAASQRRAAAVAVLRRVTVLAGGPGTGKTTTVARILALLHAQPGPPPRVALAAPTGKAAARLQEAVRAEWPEGPELPAATLHRLLGWLPRGRFRHDRHNRLPFDVVVVDETSMVSLTMTARLLEAVRPDARIVLVGDPDQLASVEAGAVLGDLTRAPGAPDARLDPALATLGLAGGVVHGVVTLDHVFRFRDGISAFARAVRDGDAAAAVARLRAGSAELEFVETGSAATPDAVRAEIVAAGAALRTAAAAGDVPAAVAALERHRLLCAHRRGPFGVARWNREIAAWLAEVAGPDEPPDGEWYPGRPVLVTANDPDTGLYNGDTGVVVETADGPRVAFPRVGTPFAPSRLPEVTTVHAMTVHRAQGSQFGRVTVVLPPPESPLLTRELLYTAVTRAREGVRVVGSEAAVRAAVERPVSRASGLRHRLGG